MSQPFIIGERVYLRTIVQADLNQSYLDWFNDSEVTHHMVKGAFPQHIEQQKVYFENVIVSHDHLVLAIICNDEQVHIGNVGLHHIDPVHRYAELGIIIGDKRYWGKGYGAEAIRLICQHGFNQLNLHRIELGVLGCHAAAIRSYEKIGFQHEGIRRKQIFKNGQYEDVVLMGILQGNWS